MEALKFRLDDGEEAELKVLEQTVITGITYLLVTDAEDDEDGYVYIFKDVSAPEDEDACYVEVTEDTELQAVYRVFTEMMEDEDLV